MAKVRATHSAYQILEDIMNLASGFAKLGKTLAAQKIQSSADVATNFVSETVDMSNINAHLSDAKESFEHASDYALNTDVKQMVDDATMFARKHPVASVISIVAVGAMVATMLRTSTSVAPSPTKSQKTPARKVKSKSAKTRTKAAVKANGSARVNA
jgi:ElaB/YqjD/DUF883 family membrane-anchored ribosome-binding protein